MSARAIVAALFCAMCASAQPLERPMILPKALIQTVFEGDLTNTHDSFAGGMRQGGLIGFGLDAGIGGQMQLGFHFSFPVEPVVRGGDFIATFQAGLIHRVMSLRLDFGSEQFNTIDSTVAANTFIYGIGLPVRLRLHRMVALVSGSTTAREFGTPFLQVKESRIPHALWIGAAFTSNDLVAFQVGDGFGGVSVFLPVGILVQPHPLVSFAVRSGYRYIRWNVVEEHFVPLSVDLTFTVGRVDLGFTATVLGLVHASANGLPPGVDFAITTQGFWNEIQRYDFFVMSRF